MIRMRRLFSQSAAASLAAVLALACAPTEKGVTQAQAGDAVIVLSEGPCLGTCPVYDLTLRSDGGFMLNGQRFVKTEGVTEGNIGADAWTTAENVLEEAGFWMLDPVQTMETRANCHTDAPTVLVTWRTTEGKEKTTTYNAGCGIRSMNEMISALRTALHFDDLVWTDEKFHPETGER